MLSYPGTSVNILSNVSQYQLNITYFGMYKCKMGLMQLKKAINVINSMYGNHM